MASDCHCRCLCVRGVIVHMPDVDPSAECAICLSLLSDRTSMQLPCGHSYHRKCVSEWLRRTMTCPSCRTALRWTRSEASLAGCFAFSTQPELRICDSRHVYGEVR